MRAYQNNATTATVLISDVLISNRNRKEPLGVGTARGARALVHTLIWKRKFIDAIEQRATHAGSTKIFDGTKRNNDGRTAHEMQPLLINHNL